MNSWWKHAACRGKATEDFFPVATGWSTRVQVPPAIQALCDACPVREECLNHALHYGEYGVWGGTTERQREGMMRNIRRAKCPACFSGRLYFRADVQTCLSCGVAWPARKQRVSGRRRRRPLTKQT